MNAVVWQKELPDLRARLVSRARRLGADVASAEDLAQEALYEGWRLRDRLTDPAGIERWHYAILRNLFLRWVARRDVPAPVDDEVDGGADIEIELERRELAELLDRALAQLPEKTREVLVRRFVEESPIKEVAERLGLSEGAVQMRLQRGKLAMREALSTDEAAAYGLVDRDGVGWQQTRIWCPCCGQQQWRGRFSGPHRQLELHCRGCHEWYFVEPDTTGYGVTGYRSTMLKASAAAFDFWHSGAINPARVRRTRTQTGVDYHIAEVPGGWTHQTLDAHALFTPLGREFWREHSRIHRMAYQQLESSGVPAVLTSYQAVDSAARLDVVLTRHTFHVVEAHRS